MPQSEYNNWPIMKKKPFEPQNDDFSGQTLQKQLGHMEGEVKEIQMELAAIRRLPVDTNPRKDTTADCIPEQDSVQVRSKKRFDDSFRRIQEDRFTKEDVDVALLREELVRAKATADEEKFQRLKYEEKLKDLESKINDICSASKYNSKESRKVSEEVVALKTQLRDMKELTEDLKVTVDEKSEQVQEYRVKYLQAQQQVEELKRQLDVMDYDSKQASDQIQIELQKMKMQFQEKLLELAPLPDLLKGAQMQLQEAKQLQKLAEENSSQISNELHRVKEKLVVAVNNLNQEKIDNTRLVEDNNTQKLEIDQKQREIDEIVKQVDDFKCQVLRLEEKLSQQETRYKEKATEYLQLVKDLEELKEESTRSINRAKERSESTRHFLQTQIAGLERQMITCRAQCRAYQKERDEIRQRMQIQVGSLKENFELIEARLRGLQGQVALLKHCYSVTLPGEVENVEQYTDT